MLDEIKKCQSDARLLISREQIETALEQMASKISREIADENPLVLCVMNGGIVVAGQLLTRLNFPLTLDYIQVSRYHNQTEASNLLWKHYPETEINQRTVLIIDDILDQGHTLKAIQDYCLEQGAKAVYSAVLVEKKLADSVKPTTAEFVGLWVEDHYIFGFGMDYKGYLRNLAEIYRLPG